MATILIAEDEQHIASVLKLVLEDEGHRVATAPDGARALETALSIRPDLIISDVMMPIMDGFELARRLRTVGSLLEAVPVIFISARPRPTAALDVRATWVAKPFELDEVLAIVERRLGEISSARSAAGVPNHSLD